MLNLKEYLRKRKYYKQKDKEHIKAEKKIEKEVEEEYKKLYPKDHTDLPNKMAKGMANFFDIIWPDDEEQVDKEYDELLTEQEKENIKEQEKEEKKMAKKAAIILIATGLTVFGIGKAVIWISRSHYEKVIAPMIIEYFKVHYNEEIESVNNNLICYQYKDENNKTQKECTDLLITTTSNNKHVLTVNDTYMGDDVNQSSFRASFKADFEYYFNDIGLVYDEAQLSYKDFYHEYNQYLDYINILPVGKTYGEMFITKKLTISAKALYQGDLSVEKVQRYLYNFSEDSVIYFIKLNQGLPKRLSIITKDNVFECDVTNSLRLADNQNITFYELDRTLNGVSSIEYKDVSTHGIQLSTNNKKYRSKKITYKYEQGKYFKFTYERKKYKEPEKAHYYILKFSNNSFIKDFILFKGNNGNYKEMDKDQYPSFVYITVGSETYVIGDNNFGIALKTEKKQGFLCNFGLC